MAFRYSFIALGALSICALSAQADLISFSSDNANSASGLGDFDGSIDYTPGNGSLVVTLTNTNATAAGGKIVGFVFNIGGSDAGATASLVSTDFPLFLDTGNESAAPFGTFDAGAALDANWEGGGNPNNGIHIGQTGTFTFQVSATDAASLLAIDFLDGSAADFDFIVRFRGFDNGDSDKVPATPAPGALAALGLAGIAGLRRRR